MFGQIVIGPPGSGKTTYCNAMAEFMKGLKRKVAIINLDPANDILPYKCAVDISDLITVNDVMDEAGFGPNGGLVFCVEYLEKNLDWLKERLAKLKDHYLLFDCPGQVELYTHHSGIRNIFTELTSKCNYKLAVAHLVDSHYCSDPAKFISVLFTSLATMMQIELPHINILSKADLIEKHGRLPFSLDFFTEVQDLSYLMDHFTDDPFFKKYRKLNEAMIGIITDYSYVSFVALHIEDKESMWRVVKSVDRANGYYFHSDEESNLQMLMSTAIGAEFEYEKIGKIQEKYIKTDESAELDGLDSACAYDSTKPVL